MIPFTPLGGDVVLRIATDMKEDSASLTTYARTHDGKVLEEWNYLDNFFKVNNLLSLKINSLHIFQKVNWALLDKVANEGERKRLQMENDELRMILKQYLNGISVTPDTVQEDNPLMVVNSRSGIAIHQPVREGWATHIFKSGKNMTC